MATTLDYKHLSNAVYGSSPQQQVGNWILHQASDPTDPTGYFGAAYRHSDTGEIVFVHRGTNDLNDVHSDTQLAAGYVMDQYAKAEAFRLSVLSSFEQPPSNISATGHSLGGAIAQLQAAANGYAAETFNAPGMASAISDFNSRYPDTPIGAPGSYISITNHRIDVDPVSIATGDHIGTVQTYPLGSGFIALLLIFGTPGVVGGAGLAGYLHKMSNFDYVLPNDPVGGNLGSLEGICLPEVDPSVSTSYSGAQLYVPPRRDPLIFDLDGDGLETVGIDAGNPILFDHDGDGIKTATGWVKADDAFLVLDRNGNGTIDNGRELFGDNTVLAGGGLAADGFAALADVDGNGDGQINQADGVFANLRLWRDFNQDGVSNAGELFFLGELGIASISTAKTQNSQLLPDGNRIADLGTYTKSDGSLGGLGETSLLGDIDLAEDTFHSQFTDQLPISAEAAALPEMGGSGMVRDLREAATISPALRDLLVQFSQTTDRAGQIALLDAILRAWSETSTMPTTYTGAYAGHSSVTTRFDGGSLPNRVHLEMGNP